MSTTVLSNLKTDTGNLNFPHPSPPSLGDLRERVRHVMASLLVAKAIDGQPLSQADVEEARAAGNAEVKAILSALYRAAADAEARVKDLAILNDAELSGRLRTAIDRYHKTGGGV